MEVLSVARPAFSVSGTSVPNRGVHASSAQAPRFATIANLNGARAAFTTAKITNASTTAFFAGVRPLAKATALPRAAVSGRRRVRIVCLAIDQLSPEDKARIQAKGQEVAETLSGVSVFLVGMMGSGKSSVASVLSNCLGYMPLDCDAIIEQAAGKTIPEIFAEDGEPSFRDLEHAVLKEVTAMTRSVVATGGGVVLRRDNWGCLTYGLSVWLDVPLSVLARRCSKDGTAGRPMIGGQVGTEDEVYQQTYQKLKGILKARKELYEMADVHVRIDGGCGVDDGGWRDPATCTPLGEVVMQVLDAIADTLEKKKPEHRKREA
eukprot:jgi/Mesvir1/15582/Mv03201-RA.1